VAPLFCEQIASGRPITVTDPDATRYFLSIQEAVHSLIQCASPHCAKGLYVPMTGEPYRIGDLATYLLRSSSNPIVHTGLRAGDKLHEAMISARETKNREINTLHQVIGVSVDGSELKRVLDVLTSAIRKRDIAQMMNALEAVVPEYSMSALLRSRVQAVEQAMR
jgi:FlaA1/EpsC-like NDP-sugar epimerase